MPKRLGFIALILLASVIAFWILTNRTPPTPQTAMSLAADTDMTGFARAYEPIPFDFPKDHGPHFDFQTEWWYYTGNLQDSAGNHYGYQLTIFRRGLTPGAPQTDAELTTNQIYFAHFAITDVTGNRHFETERFSRGAGGLAGAQGDPFRVWIEDWSVAGQNADDSVVRLQARDGQMAIDLTLRATKPVVKQGKDGLSQKSDQPGNASYYVSFTRMITQGQLTVRDQPVTVNGESWFDHEWSTKALDDVAGWNWFSLQLSDGREIMFYQFRLPDGGVGSLSSGTLVESDGSVRYLKVDEVEITVDQTWHSPTTGAEYPSHWHVVIPSAQIDLTVEPYIADQEMILSSIYWEGAVKFTGTSLGAAITGNGYIELTGYKGSLKGTF